MRGEWCYFKSAFTQEECEYILKEGLKLPSKKAVMGVSEVNALTDEKYRRSDIRFILKSHTKFEFLFDKLWKLAIHANNDWFNFHITKLDYIQLAEYPSEIQGEYKKHHDVFWINNDPIYHRKLTCVVQLTDPTTYKGGDFQLFNVCEFPNSEEIRTIGTAVFIPSFVYHAATPVTEGVRHSLAVWFDGPKWR
jgi:PKHD-type hydroxylase